MKKRERREGRISRAEAEPVLRFPLFRSRAASFFLLSTFCCFFWGGWGTNWTTVPAYMSDTYLEGEAHLWPQESVRAQSEGEQTGRVWFLHLTSFQMNLHRQTSTCNKFLISIPRKLWAGSFPNVCLDWNSRLGTIGVNAYRPQPFLCRSLKLK